MAVLEEKKTSLEQEIKRQLLASERLRTEALSERALLGQKLDQALQDTKDIQTHCDLRVRDLETRFNQAKQVTNAQSAELDLRKAEVLKLKEQLIITPSISPELQLQLEDATREAEELKSQLVVARQRAESLGERYVKGDLV